MKGSARRLVMCGFFGLTLASVSLPSIAAQARGFPDITKDGLPNIQSSAALVLDMTSGETLYERDPDAVRPIASISKLVGAMVIQEECKLDPAGLHEMSPHNRDAARGGDKSKLTTGWKYSHSDLLHAALMRSDNRALPALGEACGLDPAAMGVRMTARARAMGLTKTFFREPNGLSAEIVSTPRELMVVLRHVIQIAEIKGILGTQEHVLTAVKNGRSRAINIQNTDRLLGKNVAHILGGKTGYTDIARYCLAIAARTFTGREVGMVFLGGEGRFTRFADFTRVVKWLQPGTAYAKGSMVPAAQTTPGNESAVPLVGATRVGSTTPPGPAAMPSEPAPAPAAVDAESSNLKW